MSTADSSQVFDAIVIGTGFAGAVTACRLVEAGFHICVLERGRRYGPDDFPRYPTEDLFSIGDKQDSFKPPPDFSRWLWSRDHGIYDVRDLDDAVSVQAAGYGGGSLIYVNVHLRPPRELFNQAWPDEYRVKNGVWDLDDYFDLAAYMLRVSPIPKQLAKTIQLKKAGEQIGSPTHHWFRTPLAVNFQETEHNAFHRAHHACDMRGRCWLGCDHQAKNTLDKNYLARAEDGHTKPDIHTLAEVKTIVRKAPDLFAVTYDDVLFREREDAAKRGGRRRHTISGRRVFLCAGALNTTELLLKNWMSLNQTGRKTTDETPLGSHYFPNADSVAAVFNCKEPHEADYGPTITAALLYKSPAQGEFSCSLDFDKGHLKNGYTRAPAAGLEVRGKTSGATATLSHEPLLDWGSWQDGAAGALLLTDVEDQFKSNGKRFESGEVLLIGDEACAIVRSGPFRHEHWFLAQDGGYPPDIEPLIGMFRSPLWLRRNRYIEFSAVKPAAPPRRPPEQHLRLQSFSDSVLGTARRAGSASGFVDRAFDPRQVRAAGLLADQISTFFPKWFVKAFTNDRKEILDRGAALALPLLGRLLGELSKTVAEQMDSDRLSDLLNIGVTDAKKEVFIRGMLRQGLQILAGSEAAVATKAANLLLNPVPETPEQLLNLLGDVLLWALDYGAIEGHTGIILTMGRDLHRGRLSLKEDGRGGKRLTARLPNALLDTSSVFQERVLRVIASEGWKGELRTNPAWTTLGKRLTVHNQGGCPMGNQGLGVTDSWGEVHDCPGLYVMDAAAFPTSVGVNPSATIAAVAEFKIERFIRKERDRNWRARDKADAKNWVEAQRADIDPLNQGAMQDSPPPRLDVLTLSFSETMRGFLEEVAGPSHFDDLETFPKHLRTFVSAEEAGINEASKIALCLTATSSDLARLISAERTVAPMKMELTGTVRFGDDATCTVEPAGSFLQLFVRSREGTKPPTRFFRYLLKFVEDGRTYELEGLKVLRDAPGFDLWSDTSTLYFEIRPHGNAADRSQAQTVRRGILRISLEDFLQKQLQSIEIDGTDDTARKSWALAAFYKYFIGELATIYVTRADALKELVMNMLTGIHV